MIPAIVKKCTDIQKDGSDTEVLLRIDPLSDCKQFPDFALVYEDDDYWIGIRENFASDGGSLHRSIWTITGLTPYDVRCRFGFFIHDGIYKSHLLPQKQGDIILDKIMQIKPSPNWVQRQIVYYALRVGGFKAYNSKTQSEIDDARKYVVINKKNKLKDTIIK